jgi:hypothetical protein
MMMMTLRQCGACGGWRAQDSEKTPLQALHVREAVRRTQHLRYSAVGFTASHLRKERFV